MGDGGSEATTTPRRDRALRRAEAKPSIISSYDNIANVPSEASAERSESAIYHKNHIMPAASIARRAIFSARSQLRQATNNRRRHQNTDVALLATDGSRAEEPANLAEPAGDGREPANGR